MPGRVDVTAHFEISDIIVTLGEQDFIIPAMPASRWLSILTAKELDGTRILPGLLSNRDQAQVDDLLLAGQLSVDELIRAIRNVITVASGHDWWWSLGLLSVVQGQSGTQVLGEMSRINAQDVSLAQWLNTLYALFVKYMKGQDRAQFDSELESPPPGVDLDPEEVIDEETSTAAFMGMMRNQNR